jgi:hypothetical protein
MKRLRKGNRVYSRSLRRSGIVRRISNTKFVLVSLSNGSRIMVSPKRLRKLG